MQSSTLEGVLSWTKAIVHAPVAGSIAFAFIVFAATSVGGMTLVAQAEISGGDYAAPQVAMYHAKSMAVETAVLGDQTTVPSMQMVHMSPILMVPQTVSFSVTATPNQNSTSTKVVGYSVQYNLGNASTSGVSIAVGGKVQAKNLPASGTVAITVRPGMNEISFSGKIGNRNERLLSFTIMTLPPLDKIDQGDRSKSDCSGDNCPSNATSSTFGTLKPMAPKRGNEDQQGHGSEQNPSFMKFQDGKPVQQ